MHDPKSAIIYITDSLFKNSFDESLQMKEMIFSVKLFPHIIL